MASLSPFRALRPIPASAAAVAAVPYDVVDVTEAAVWITEGGLLKYAFEVAKANASKTTPDVGERRDLNFH